MPRSAMPKEVEPQGHCHSLAIATSPARYPFSPRPPLSSRDSMPNCRTCAFDGASRSPTTIRYLGYQNRYGRRPPGTAPLGPGVNAEGIYGVAHEEGMDTRRGRMISPASQQRGSADHFAGASTCCPLRRHFCQGTPASLMTVTFHRPVYPKISGSVMPASSIW